MAPEEEVKQKKVSKEEFDIISNRLAVALAKRESLIKSWTASSRKPASTRTPEESDAEDALLFRNQPAYLGVGAAIPAHFFTSDTSQDNKSLRSKFFPASGLKASKARDSDEKAASAKRAKKEEEETDEEQGRSGLGRAKKLKSKSRIKPTVKEDPPEEPKVVKKDMSVELEAMKARKIAPEEDNITKEAVLKVQETKMLKPEPEVPTTESNEDAPAENASSLLTSMEDTAMSDSPPANETTSKTTSKHTMDTQEKKRMKKREKKKRMRAKQKIAQSTAE